jgi:hypothetical protein
MEYIVALECDKEGNALQFIANWPGDPGRTCVIDSARRYKSPYCATLGLAHARRYRDFKDAKLIEVAE